MLRAVRRNSRGLRIGAAGRPNLCNLPVSRHRNGAALLDGRVCFLAAFVGFHVRPWMLVVRKFLGILLLGRGSG